MVGRFSLSSLPSIPASLADLLDTSPQVFYPPSRPASRASTSTAPTSSVSSSCPSSPRRRPVAFPDDRGIPPIQPTPPFWSGAAHPHTDAPLGSRDRPLAQLPPRQSSLSGGRIEPQRQRDPQWQPTRPPRPSPSHRRSHSAAPTSFNYSNPATYNPPPLRVETRGLHPSSSAASLPTLAEDATASALMPPPPLFPPLVERAEERKSHNRRWSWIAPAPKEERSRRRAQSTVTMTAVPGVGTFVEPPLPERLRRRHSQIVGRPSAPVLSKPLTAVCPSTPSRSRRGSVCSITFPDGVKASPTPARTSVSVSDVAALATWSEEPISPTLSRSHSQRESVASPPSESLRARLRTLSKLEGRECPATPPKLGRRNTLASPHSTVVTPGHGTPATPGSSTPTTSSHSHMQPPLSPTPTRRRTMHRHTLSLPFAEESRPTTSRLRQPAQLSMAPMLDDPPHRPAARSRPVSMLGPPSPLLASSPGSLVSDNGSSSPTASIESLTLSPAWLNLNLTLSSQQKRSSYSSEREHEPSRDSRSMDKRHSISDKRNSISSLSSLSLAASRRGSTTSAYDWRRGAPPPTQQHTSRPSVSISDDIDGERFLDFDDI